MGLSLYCANEGHLKGVEVAKILDFESAILSFANSEYAAVMKEINDSGNWNAELEGKFKELVEKFKATQTW